MFLEPEEPKASSPASPTASQVMMHLSVAALAGTSAPKTLRFAGQIMGHPLSILVDLGSSHMSALQIESPQCIHIYTRITHKYALITGMVHR